MTENQELSSSSHLDSVSVAFVPDPNEGSSSNSISENANPTLPDVGDNAELEESSRKEGFSKKGWRREQQRILMLKRRPILRKLEKERRKAKKEQAKQEGTFVGKPRKYKMSESLNKQRICIDLDFSAVSFCFLYIIEDFSFS